MNRQHGTEEAGFAIIVTIVFLFVMAFFSAWSCHSKWGRSGMKAVSWGPVQGCMCQLPDGRWLPEERIREVDIPKGDAK